MRPYPLTVLNGGINRLRVKGGASASQLYDLTNAYVTNAGSVVPREGTIRAETLTSGTVGLMAMNGVFNIFSSTFSTSPTVVPPGYQLTVLQDPVNTTASPTIIWFAKPFMGFPYVVAQFSDGLVFNYWLQNNGTWAANTVYTSGSIVLPTPQNGLAYQGVRDFPPNPLWSANSAVSTLTTSSTATIVEPTVPTGYAYKAVIVVGTNPHTGSTEPVWPAAPAATIQEFGDFSETATAVPSTGAVVPVPLGSNITDKYGDSATIANTGTVPSGNLILPTAAANAVTTWMPGTSYAPGAVVRPTTNQGGYINAIPNGDFEAGNDGNWVLPTVGTLTWAYDSTMADAYKGTWCLTLPAGSDSGGGANAHMLTSGNVSPGQVVTATAYVNPNNTDLNTLQMQLVFIFYDKTNTAISGSLYPPGTLDRVGGFGYRPIHITQAAPVGAAGVRVYINAYSANGSFPNPAYVDNVVWNLEQPAAVSNFLYEAVQPLVGSSATHEPTWPTTVNNTVIDNTVTWIALGTSIITWEAIPLMLSNATTQPVFPTTIGNTVNDPSTFTDLNGVVTAATSMSWKAISRVITDPNAPNTIPVALGASHIFEGNNDIVDYSAAVNPTDWTSPNNAGYLPTGMNNYGDNPVAALALYRSNLVVFNAGGYQMWQIDPDPANMALLDAEPVGSVYPRAAQSVANDLLFLTEVGVRNLGTVGATANLQIGNTGQPVDPLVMAQVVGTYVTQPVSRSRYPLSLYYPGRGQYWLIFGPQAFVLTINGASKQTWSRYIFPDSITDWTLNGGILYLRSAGNLVWQIDNATLVDDASVSGAIAANTTLLIPFDGSLSGYATGGATYTLTTQNGAITTTSAVQFGSGSLAILPGQPYYASVSPPTTCVGSFIPIGAGGISDITSSDFTVEGWFNVSPATANLYPLVVFNYGHGAYSDGHTGFTLSAQSGSPGVVSVAADVAGWPSLSGSPTITAGTWYHFAVVRSGITASLYINGVLQGSSQTWPGGANPEMLTLGCSMAEGAFGTGWIDEVRLSTVARYTSNFTPPTAAFALASATPFTSLMQWPYCDCGPLGINKMMVGVDLVGDGACLIQVAFNQADKTTFDDNSNFATSTGVTAPYAVLIDDTVPGEPLPIPINAPSYSLILTFPSVISSAQFSNVIGTQTNPWTWEAANLYLTDESGGGATG